MKYLVTSSSSLGLSLYDEESETTIIKKIPGKLKYNNIDIYIGDYVYIDQFGNLYMETEVEQPDFKPLGACKETARLT